MAIKHICFKLLSAPPSEKQYKIGTIYTLGNKNNTNALMQEVQFNGGGIYELEYWAVNHTGLESIKKHVELNMTNLSSPSPIPGAKFDTPITPDSKQVILSKDEIKIIFSTKPEGFGTNFDWNTMNLSGLRCGKSVGTNKEYFISIQPGCWLSKKLNNEKCSIEIQIPHGKIIMLQSHAITNVDGTLKQDLPQCCRGFVNKVWKAQDSLCFLLRKACSLTIEA